MIYQALDDFQYLNDVAQASVKPIPMETLREVSNQFLKTLLIEPFLVQALTIVSSLAVVFPSDFAFVFTVGKRGVAAGQLSATLVTGLRRK